MVFSRDTVEGMIPPMVLVEDALWNNQDAQVIYKATAVTAFMGLTPNETEVPYRVQYLYMERFTIISLVSLMLPPPYQHYLSSRPQTSIIFLKQG